MTREPTSEFLDRLTAITEANLTREDFGPEILAGIMRMSRSTLHRKIRTVTNKSISHFIREVRLNKARELLNDENFTISEVAWKVGFGSPSYFTRCFHAHFGFSPGESKKNTSREGSLNDKVTTPENKQKKWLVTSVLLVALLMVLFFTHEMFNFPFLPDNNPPAKSIAVLPFRNDSPDPANAYFINGVMESILNNLSSIEDLNVRSRTSVERYRETSKSLKEIAKEMDVFYLVEGSGQKYGEQLVLNIQLVEANTDRHLFSEQYRKEIREVKDFIDLQSEIAIVIGSKTKAVITPEEERYMKEIPTKNMAAYNFYLRGYEYLMLAKKKPLWQFAEECNKAKQLLKEAVRLDPTFSEAYRHLAHNYINNLSFFCNDISQAEKYLDTGLVMVNKALEYDYSNWGALAIKRQYYLKKGMFREAEKIQKQLHYKWSDNYDIYEINFGTNYWLDDYYNAIRSFYNYIKVKPKEIPPYMIFMTAQCFADMGYPQVAKKYAMEFINQYNDSLSYYSTMAFIELLSGNFQTSAQYGISALSFDSTDVSAILFLLIAYTYQKNHPEINRYLEKLEQLDTGNYLWVNSDLFAGFACLETGAKNRAQKYFKQAIKTQQTAIEENTPAAQRFEAHIYLAAIYAALGEKEKALTYLNAVMNRNTITKAFLIQLQFWPGTEQLKEDLEYRKIYNHLNAKYQKEHQRIGELLREMGEI